MNKVTMERPSGSSISSLPSKSAESSGIGDIGSRSEISSIENKVTGTEKGFMWKSQYQHAMYFIAYTFSWGLFSSYRKGQGYNDEEHIPTCIHMILVYILFAGPMLYLQIFIGQYTQRGCIVLGAMLPVAYGVGYVMLLNTLISCSLNIYFCSSILYYTFVAMINYPTPSWMLCLSDYVPSGKRCFSRDEIDLCPSCMSPDYHEPCFDPTQDIFSASLFKDVVIFSKDESGFGGGMTTPSVTHIVHIILTAVCILVLAVRNLKDLDDSIRIGNVFAVVSIIITIAVLLLNHPRLNFVENMFRVHLESLFSYKCWSKAFSSTAYRLNIMEGGHFLFGSYMPLTVNCTNRVTYILIVHLVFLLLCNVIAYMMEDFLACSISTNVKVLNAYSDIESTFAIYPTALGILAAAQLWSTLYFLILFSMTLHSTVLQIIFVQETLSQEIIDPTYYIYTRIMLVVLTSSTALFFTSPAGSVLAVEIFFHRSVILFILIIIVYIIVFLYGLDRFSDDIHFILHSPPSKYLKWSWIISAIASAYFLINFFIEGYYLVYPRTSITIMIMIFVPMPVGLLYQLIKAVRARELSKLMKSSSEFGPQDSEERANRRLFNPRHEVRFRRRRNYCKHRCLLDSVILRKCLEKELTLLTHVLLEIEDNEEERVIKKDFLMALHKHREIMTNALNFDPSKEYFRNRRTEYRYVSEK